MAQPQARPAARPLQWLVARRQALVLGLVLAVGAALRLYGHNWDGGQWLHPDERQIYFVTLGLGWPHSLAQAFSPDSPLNPHFFAYGSLPFYLLKIAAALAAPLSSVLRDPGNLHLVGRPLAALFDLGTVYLTYRLARKLEVGGWGAVLAAGLASFAVVSIQIAHFYTADTLLAFFVTLSLNLAADVAQGAGWGRQLALGVAVGLALATKVSAAPLVLVVIVAFVLRQAASSKQQITSGEWQAASSKQQAASDWQVARGKGGGVTARSRIAQCGSRLALTGFTAGAVFFLAQPYALIDWRTFVADTVRESQIAWGVLDVPYTRQYTGTLPYLYSIWQTASWGLGLPLGVAAWAGFGASVLRWLRRGSRADSLLLAWAGPYLGITGLFHARYLRYMLPLAPVLCLFAAWLMVGRGQEPRSQAYDTRSRRRQWAAGIAGGLAIALTLAYALALASLYAAPHPWITASEWIYRTVPAGSRLAVEEWDTALPLPLNVDGRERRIEEYDVRSLALYEEPDDAAKWSTLAADLAESDYLIVASRRLYGSIPRLPDRYPIGSRYYDLLFDGELGFEPAGEFSRGPGWLNPPVPPLPGAVPAWLAPDESFVVYDHPRALVFRNSGRLTAGEILERLGGLRPAGN